MEEKQEEKKVIENNESNVKYNVEDYDRKIEMLRENYSNLEKHLQTLEASLSTKIKDEILSKIFVKKDEEKKEEVKKEEILEDF